MTQTRNKTLTLAAVLLIACAAAGAGFAASKLNGSSSKGAAASGGTPISSLSGGKGRLGFGGGPGRDGHGHGPGHHLSAAATYLGITEAALVSKLQAGQTLAQVANATSGKSAAGLIDALVAAAKADLDAAVKAGRITQAQADTIASTLKARITEHVNATGPPNRGFGPGHGHHGPGGHHLAAAATYLGISESALITQLQAGKTLAQVADATSGKSAAGLIDALVADETAELDAAVTAGRITKAQRDQIVPTLKERITAHVNGTRPPGMHDGGPPPAGAAFHI